MQRSRAEGRALRGGMHVRNVRANGQMNRHGDALLVCGNQQAQFRVFGFQNTAGEILSGRFTVANADAVSQLGMPDTV